MPETLTSRFFCLSRNIPRLVLIQSIPNSCGEKIRTTVIFFIQNFSYKFLLSGGKLIKSVSFLTKDSTCPSCSLRHSSSILTEACGFGSNATLLVLPPVILRYLKGCSLIFVYVQYRLLLSRLSYCFFIMIFDTSSPATKMINKDTKILVLHFIYVVI